jgi:hypothetical protein
MRELLIFSNSIRLISRPVMIESSPFVIDAALLMTRLFDVRRDRQNRMEDIHFALGENRFHCLMQCLLQPLDLFLPTDPLIHHQKYAMIESSSSFS